MVSYLLSDTLMVVYWNHVYDLFVGRVTKTMNMDQQLSGIMV